ncbi:DNA-directed RNA polymerase subunit beta [Mycoplasmatota bacterium]|nr:DNA-directed RNA polymerase subunit beta [Mycoplasmatota bacterium]
MNTQNKNYKEIRYGRKRIRRNYSRISGALELPNLIEIQTNSFGKFLNEGMTRMFNDISPIKDHSENLILEFVGHDIGLPKYEVLDAKERDVTYSAPLKVKIRLTNLEKQEAVEQEVFMGDLPLMTETGTFIINGAERVIVTQLVRSSGVYFSNKDIDKKSGKEKISGQIIPTRGAWLEFEEDAKQIAYVRVDRTRKLPVTVLLKALGLISREEILDIFGENLLLLNAFDKDSTENCQEALLEIYEKLRPGEPPTIEGARSLFFARFFDDKRYDLAAVGRYKFNKKLNFFNRLVDNELAEPLIDSETGEVLFEAGHVFKQEDYDNMIENNVDISAINRKRISLFEPLEDFDCYVQSATVKVLNEDGEPIDLVVVGNNQREEKLVVTTSDIIAAVSYYFNLNYGVGNFDDIDHLGNRRLRLVGELLQNQFRIGLTRMERVVRERMSTQEAEHLTPQNLINIRPVTAAIKEFFGSSQLSQFMDKVNPLAEISNKRRLSALGPGGLTRERASMEVRDVHYSHYGRMCPIETPEGPNIGLINQLATYAKVNDYGFIETAYRKVRVIDGKAYITDEIDYFTADEEDYYVLSQANLKIDENRMIVDEKVIARHRGATIMVSPLDVNYVDVSPKQIVSVATACIPFLEHDDANRALMGANMQRQAIPLLVPEAPIVGTGIEYKAAKDAGSAVIAKKSGVVEYADAKVIRIRNLQGGLDKYKLIKFVRSNQSTCVNQKPIVSIGETVEAGEVIADGFSMDQGELALGRNVLVAFMTWNGYNYEDAIIMSERLVKDDVYTSIHIEEYEIEARDTKLGPEEITRDIPGVSDDSLKDLDERGIIRVGAEVKEGGYLVGKVTAKGQTDLSAEERLLHAIFGEKAREVRDTSLRVPHGGEGIIHDVKHFTRKNGDEMAPGVNEVIRVYIVQKRKISEGDKMAGRHGNKGVISKILPEEDMPFLPDGTVCDIMLNPLGVPSRMNIGQILELHLGMAARKLGIHVATPVFDGVQIEDLDAIIREANMAQDAKTKLYDGRTGEEFDNRISVGVMYMIKLAHMVDDKLHARSTGPYSLVTQQPLGGKAQFGGQRFGEMEVWALEAYGAAYTLQEILTVKSDDIVGRVKVYEAIIKGEPIPDPGVPESFRVLIKELQALGMDVKITNAEHTEIELKDSLLEESTVREISGIEDEYRLEYRNKSNDIDNNDNNDEVLVDDDDIEDDAE